jgi:hypothetical protein
MTNERIPREAPLPSSFLLGSSRNSRKSPGSGGASQGISFVQKKSSGTRRTLSDVVVAVALVSVIGCGDSKHDSWRSETPSTIHESNGFRFGFYGPRSSGFAPDVAPSLDVLTIEEIGLALEARALELAARTGYNAEAAVATLRGCRIFVIDDYAFEVGHMWAAGLREGNTVYVALWHRAEVPTEEEIPFDAPSWTINPPAGGYGWRYGSGDRLVPAADHELGHVLFGPYFEH